MKRIMKRNYMKPTTDVVNIGMQQPIAASGITFDSEDTGDGPLNDDFASDPLSRRWSDCWDD